jgi:NADH dehydrogenase
MNRRVITVFGGSGFIGRHLVRRLAADDWIVRVAVRDPEAAIFLKTAGDVAQINVVAADVGQPQSVEDAVDGVDAVVNLVGILYKRGRQTFHRVHVEGATTVASAAHAAGVKRLVQMSAIGADAESPSEYARSKAGGEKGAKEAFPGASIVRPSVVFGPEDDFFNRFAAMARTLHVLPVFDTTMQPVYVGDVAQAIATIVNDPSTAGKTYELGGPRTIHFRELMDIVIRETDRRCQLMQMPMGLAKVQAFFLEWLPTPPLTRDQLKLLQRDNVVSEGAPNLTDLGIQPTAVEAIVPTYLHRYRPPFSQRRRVLGRQA